jgi:hypothetical protein
MIIGGGLTSAHLASLAAAATAAAAAAGPGSLGLGKKHSNISSSSRGNGDSDSSSSDSCGLSFEADGGTAGPISHSKGGAAAATVTAAAADGAGSGGCQAGDVSLLLRGELRVKQFDVDIEWMGRNRGSTLQFGFRQLGDMSDRLALMKRVLQVRRSSAPVKGRGL